MLVDILGDDEWRRFVDITKHLGGSFVLYAERRAKQQVVPGPVPGGAMAGSNGASAALHTAGADGHGRRGVSWPVCKHGKPCTIETDWGPHSAGQWFYRCRLFAVRKRLCSWWCNASSDQMTFPINFGRFPQDAEKDCGFTQWLDDEFPAQATKHISSLLGSVGCLEKQVETLQEELDELRRRYVTDVQPLRSSRQP